MQQDNPTDDMSPADQAERFLNAMKATGEDAELNTPSPAAKKGGGKGKSMKAQPKQKAAAVTPDSKKSKKLLW